LISTEGPNALGNRFKHYANAVAILSPHIYVVAKHSIQSSDGMINQNIILCVLYERGACLQPRTAYVYETGAEWAVLYAPEASQDIEPFQDSRNLPKRNDDEQQNIQVLGYREDDYFQMRICRNETGYRVPSGSAVVEDCPGLDHGDSGSAGLKFDANNNKYLVGILSGFYMDSKTAVEFEPVEFFLPAAEKLNRQLAQCLLVHVQPGGFVRPPTNCRNYQLTGNQLVAR